MREMRKGRVDADHLPLCLEVHDAESRAEQECGAQMKKKVCSWSEEDTAKFQQAAEDLCEECIVTEKDSVQKIWDGIKSIVDRSVTKKEIKYKVWRLGERKWWDSACRKRKRKVKRAYYKWRKNLVGKVVYLKERREWRKMCEDKAANLKEMEAAQLRSIKHEKDVWKFLGAGKKKNFVENDISMDAWKEYFRVLIEGSCERMVGARRKLEAEDTESLMEEEVIMAINSLKKRKAAGCDDISNEVWKHGGPKLSKRLMFMLKKIWAGEGLPEDWKLAVVVPLYKKGDVNEEKNYRGISLLPTSYKVYTEVLRCRLLREVEAKGILPEGQAGFRKGRSTMNNIYILNHVVQTARSKKEKVLASFVDLTAAFDTVNRERLWEVMKEEGMSKGLIERVKELYEETMVTVKVNNTYSDKFWSTKGVRQGCVLSSILFCIYIAALEKEYKNRNVGGVVIGGIRVWSLAYADDLVLLALNSEAMLDMLGVLKRFLEGRDLSLSVVKTKILVFNKGRNSGKEKWLYKGEEMEEVKSVKYLGLSTMIVNQGLNSDRDIIAEISQRMKDIERQVLDSKIRESRYNTRYASIIPKEVLKYLTRCRKEREEVCTNYWPISRNYPATNDIFAKGFLFVRHRNVVKERKVVYEPMTHDKGNGQSGCKLPLHRNLDSTKV
ncbi:uncharacterized protein LOC111643501 [Copidosoma floridanum]|uniref:uncharacterized protein LOC111643501 n=1 Tax=Copidosoma floridanum TaxID=29053 RepID=UPI000C6FA09F|nr:uncharacterized protein LOC111643501 [Copidosoma floridanum]